MTTPAEYREFAIDCMRLAEQEENAGLRDTMMGLARVWFRTALMMDEHVMVAGDDPARSKELRDGLD
jgi:hypothetical protein